MVSALWRVAAGYGVVRIKQASSMSLIFQRCLLKCPTEVVDLKKMALSWEGRQTDVIVDDDVNLCGSHPPKPSGGGRPDPVLQVL